MRREPAKHIIMKIGLAILVLLLFATGMSLPAGAQDLSPPRPRQGYYIGFAAFGTTAGFYTAETGWLGPPVGPGGTLHVGQALNNQIALGINAGASTLFDSDRRFILGDISIEVKWSFYRQLFIRPSIGFGITDVTRRHGNVVSIISDVGAAYHLSTGYDFFPFHQDAETGGVAVTPILWVGGSNGNHLHSISGGIGLEISFWAGLPKNQLRLPEDQAYKQ